MTGRGVRGRRRTGGCVIVALTAGAVLSGCGSGAPSSTAAVAVASADPLPTVTTTARSENGFGLDLRSVDALFASPLVHVVVEGTVTAIAYESGRPHPHTSIVIEVERARGTTARRVTVEEVGGVVRQSELWSPPSRPPKAGSGSGPTPPVPAPSDRVIDMQPEWGAARAAVGDRVVMFLYSSPFTTNLPDHYVLVGGTLGRFRYDAASDSYVRAGKHKGFETTLVPAVLDRELTSVP